MLASCGMDASRVMQVGHEEGATVWVILPKSLGEWEGFPGKEGGAGGIERGCL